MTKRKNTRTQLDRSQINKLIKSAKSARRYSRAPYTGIKVGSAILSKTGKIYTGTNVESIIPNSSLCAERNAIFKALSEGERDFSHIAIVAFKKKYIYPCGTCRQILSEYSTKIKIVLADLGERYRIMSLQDLFPKAPEIKKVPFKLR